MSRTRLFGALQRAFDETGLAPRSRALSRRSFLVMSAALAACNGAAGPNESVAIVGGGAAGLTIAYRLAKAGRTVTLYEASDRLGGRMFTKRDFNAGGQFCELGGELVDSNHEALRKLAAELGVPIDHIKTEDPNAQEFYQIDGRLYTQHDMLAHGRGAFADLAHRIAEDQSKLLDSAQNWTPQATALDNQSVAAYLASAHNQAPAWAMQLLDLAYHGEYGISTAQQSALNLVDFIGTEAAHEFRMFGESDETSRIHGGSSTLTDTLAERLDTHVAINRRHVLAAIARSGNGVTLSFDSPAGRVAHEHARVVLALPFTKLRQVDGLDTLGLSAMKLRAIRELGYGDNSKLMVSTRSRPWNDARAFKAPTAGEFFSDKFQCIWDTSRGQPGETGILTNFLTGQHDRNAALANMRAGLHGFAHSTEVSLDDTTMAFMDWPRQPFVLGSYAGAKVGQYTTLLLEAGTPSSDGRIQFAGEHTSTDFLGFMNGAVDSGERVARALLA